MIITYKNFVIEIQEYSYDLYQIRQPKQFHKVKNMEEPVKVSLGYFHKIENCVDTIIRVVMSTRDEKVDLRNFLELYRSLKNDILSTIT